MQLDLSPNARLTIIDLVDLYQRGIERRAKRQKWRPLEIATAKAAGDALHEKVKTNDTRADFTNYDAMIIVDTLPEYQADIDRRAAKQKWRPSEIAMATGACVALRALVIAAFPNATGQLPGTTNEPA